MHRGRESNDRLGNGLNSVAAGGGFRGMANGSNILPYKSTQGRCPVLCGGPSSLGLSSRDRLGLTSHRHDVREDPLGKDFSDRRLYQDTVVATLTSRESAKLFNRLNGRS